MGRAFGINAYESSSISFLSRYRRNDVLSIVLGGGKPPVVIVVVQDDRHGFGMDSSNDRGGLRGQEAIGVAALGRTPVPSEGEDLGGWARQTSAAACCRLRRAPIRTPKRQ